VLAALAARERACVELARELVATPSPNPPGDERAIAVVVRQAMTALGYRDPVTIACAEHRPNIVGEVGSGSRALILNGHLDTKPPGNERDWETAPYDPVIRHGRLYGLGSTDMKGAVAAMVHAGAALAEAAELGGTLRVVLSADEEAGSVFGARFLAETRAVKADAVLVGEPTGITSGWEYLAVASRGISCFRVVCRGTQMHSSLSDRLPSVNASLQLARVLTRVADELELPEGATLNVGVTLRGGIFWGVYPGEAEAGVEVRTVPGMTLEDLRDNVECLLERLRAEDPELEVVAEWVPELAWFPPSAIDEAHALVDAARQAAHSVLGREIPTAIMPASTDGAHWSQGGIAAIPALGPGLLPLAHRPNEYVNVHEVVEAARIYALTALRYLSVPKELDSE
jgi:acetylornithine deacetylase/succinyl-diaminopimelate desuccinylase-like protein